MSVRESTLTDAELEALVSRLYADASDAVHATHVTALAESLFEAAGHLHGLTKTARDWLRIAGRLHDVARGRDKANHHRLGGRAMRRLRGAGLSASQRRILARAVELHSKRSDLSGVLTGPRNVEEQIAARLGALLRIADGLDHSRTGETRLLALVDDGEAVDLYINDSPEAAANAADAMARIDLFNAVCPRPIRSIVPAAAVPAEAAVIRPTDTLLEAVQRLLVRQLDRLQTRRYGIAYPADAEYVHEMRVATRRLRSGMGAVRKQIDGHFTRLRKRLKGLADTLGPARDADVFLEFLAGYSDTASPGHGPALQRALRAERRTRSRRYRAVAELLASGEHDRLMRRARRVLTMPPGPAFALCAIGKRAGRCVWREARRSLRKQLSRVYAYGPRLAGLSIRKQHALRIECKRLRYLAEFFADLYPERLESVRKPVEELQDLLGEVHDTYVYAERLDGHLRGLDAGAAREIRSSVNPHLAARRRSRLAKAGRVWRRFAAAKAKHKARGAIDAARRE